MTPILSLVIRPFLWAYAGLGWIMVMILERDRWMRWTIATLVFVAGLSGLMSAQPRPTLAGTYECHGTHGRETYVVTLRVTAMKDMYEFHWLSSTGDVSLIGIGLPDHGSIAVGILGPKGFVGVALYTAEPGHLAGVWTSGEGIERETCRIGRPA